MTNELKLSQEEKYIIDMLFNQKKHIKNGAKSMNYEFLIEIASAHLMLPSLYLNIKRKKLVNSLPNNLIKYLEEIYDLNSERNKMLIKEIEGVSNILNTNKIDHVFFKGSANLLNKIYFENGERMVGDMDILVNSDQYIETIELLNKNGYLNKNKLDLVITSNERHYPRLIKKSKLFALEIHDEFLRKKFKNILKKEEILNDKILIKDNIYTPSIIHQILISIYNYQINDFGYIQSSYSYRPIYDVINLINEFNIDVKSIKEVKYVKDFFQKTDYLGITNYYEENNNLLFIIDLKHRFKLFNIFYKYFSKYFLTTIFRLNLKKIFKEKSYREYIYKKIRGKIKKSFKKIIIHFNYILS